MESFEQPPPPPPPPPATAGPPSGGHDYPLTFAVDYPERSLNRLSTAFRIFTVIPIAILLSTLEGGGFGGYGTYGARYAGGGIGILFVSVLLMLLFRKKYPRWWYDWNLQLTRFSNRVGIYVALMDDRYPSTDEEQAVHLDFPYPDAERESAVAAARQMAAGDPPLPRPHRPHDRSRLRRHLRLVRDPLHRQLSARAFDFVEGVIRWHNRVAAYALLLITDRYPPFSLQP